MKKGNLVSILIIALLIPTFVAIYLTHINPTSNNLMFLFGCGIEDVAVAMVMIIDDISEWNKKEG